MQVAKNTVVTLHYKLQRDDSNGSVIEETHGKDPLVFLYGVGQMIPEFEDNLAGKRAGDELSFGIDHLNAYGEYDPDAVIKLPISTFMVDGRIAEDMLQPGRRIPMQDQDGNRINGIVQEVSASEVMMNFNHPLAGVDLYFTVAIEEVRAATDSELAHGHVHGPGGHHH